MKVPVGEVLRPPKATEPQVESVKAIPSYCA